jgi:hypothetical protein
MHFNNNLGGTYRHYEMERLMIQWLWYEVENGTAGVIPSKFARVAAFMLAYGNIGQGRSVVSESTATQLVSRMLGMAPQFSKMDCMYVSRGLQVGASLGSHRKGISSRFVDVFRSIDMAMNSRAELHLQEDALSLVDINTVMKAYISRGGQTETELFGHLVNR